MSLSISQSATAVGPNCPASFVGIGGTEPYVYSVVPGGAGGFIDASTGEYTAPPFFNSDPAKVFDQISVTDASPRTVTTRILVGSPLLLICEIVQREMGLPQDRVYLWDQKLMQPTNSGLYIAVSMPSCKPFSNVNSYASVGGNLQSQQFVNMSAVVDFDIISRGPEARDRKEEIVLAMNSNYAQQQQESNSFYVGKIPVGFINLSDIDGAAIPYRYRISFKLQYAFLKNKNVQYFNDFTRQEFTNP